MTIALYPVAGLLVVLLLVAAGRKLSGRPDVVESYARVGVSRRQLPRLAAVLIVGALGVVGGFFWMPLGVAASACLAVYFVLALIAHARYADLAHAATPALLLLLACSATVLFALGAGR
ncbi:DoxX family protein [Agromyces sp. NPDC058484]|uniref:DoxX family protein n=1 Tax=Agromyces sp. NPDC058484 TaxID=3346524 RepID=UPI00364E3C30